jgi:Arc/MetJ-type ribon-helix-helix transcriptional regulator
MATVNVSLPAKLKTAGDELVKEGYYASFSDLVRDSLRGIISQAKNELNFARWDSEIDRDVKSGEATTLKNPKDIENYVKSL